MSNQADSLHDALEHGGIVGDREIRELLAAAGSVTRALRVRGLTSDARERIRARAFAMASRRRAIPAVVGRVATHQGAMLGAGGLALAAGAVAIAVLRVRRHAHAVA